MRRQLKCLPIAVEYSERLQDAINDYQRVVKRQGTLGEPIDAHRILSGFLSEMSDERIRAIYGAIPKETLYVDSIQNPSVAVELDPKIEKLIDEASSLSQEHIGRITGATF